jgi:uncharacterized protein (TIGR02147 family)
MDNIEFRRIASTEGGIAVEVKLREQTKAPDIFAYTDYRKYMKDFFLYMKSEKPFFSYQYFAEKAGFKAKSFVHKVIKGERALSNNSVFTIARALNLKGKEIAFFEAMVHFNDSSTASEREYYFTRMQQVDPKNDGIRLHQNQYEYFSKWYHAVIRELVTILPFDGDYQKLGQSVQPPVTARQAIESVALLLELGLIQKVEHSKLYQHTSTYITTRDSVVSLAVNKFQRETMELALKAHEDSNRNEQDFSSLTIGISAKGYERIHSELKEFRAYIGKIVADDNPSDRVYQMNFQLFRLDRINSRKEG